MMLVSARARTNRQAVARRYGFADRMNYEALTSLVWLTSIVSIA